MAEWLEHMPEIELARGVPVINIKNGARKIVVKVEGGLPVLALKPAVRPPIAPKLWRVDLGDPIGWYYALRYAWRRGSSVACLTGWREDRITDEDRVALAKALQEVTP